MGDALLTSVTGDGITLPHDADLEGEVLAACIIHPVEARVPASWLEPEDFYNAANRHIWAGIRACYDKHGTVDEVLLPAELKRAGVFEAIGYPKISALLSRSGSTSNVAEYARIIRDYRVRRDIFDAAAVIEAEALATDEEILRTVETVERRLRAATELAAPHTIARAIDGMAAHVEACQRAEESGGLVGVPSGIRELDEATGGLQPGWLVLIMAPPGGGKTALALNNYAREALRASIPVLVFSLEMRSDEVNGRLVAAESGVPFNVQRSGKMTTQDKVAFTHGVARVERFPLYIEDEPHRLSCESIRLACLRVVQEAGGLGLVVFDYIQLARNVTGRKDATDEQEISALSRTLKMVALEFACPVIAISQPDKTGQRGGGRLKLVDAKGSQAIGADCDLALMPFLPEVDGVKTGDAEINAPKFRHGPQFRISSEAVKWNGGEMRFKEAWS